jgi:hypothetical protein
VPKSPTVILERLSLLLAILIGTLVGAVAIALSQFSDHSYEILGKWIGYRWLVTLVVISGLSTLGCLVAWFILNHKLTHLKAEDPLPKPIQPKQGKSETQVQRENLFKFLTLDEKKILAEYVKQDKKSIVFQRGPDGMVTLINNDIIVTTNYLDFGPYREYTISQWAWEMLKQNPQLVKT